MKTKNKEGEKMKLKNSQSEDMRESPKHRVEEHESLRKVMEGK